jgi:bilin biosynthesis protein
MDKRFFNIFNLTEAEAIALLDTPQDQIVDEEDSRYIAASHLVNFPTEASIAALIRAIETTDPSLNNRIARRKSVETLGRLEAVQAIPTLRGCLKDPDCYTVENAVWSIAEIGTTDPAILEEIAEVLDRPAQSYRVIIHALTKLNYKPAVDRIRRFIDDAEPTIASAAMTAVCRLTEDYSLMNRVVEMLQHSNVFARRLCIQDLMDVQYYQAIPQITRAPVSLVFRLRGIRSLAESAIELGKLTFADIQPALEQSLRDHPKDLDLVHAYDRPPTLEFLIRELYETDFGRCYLATKTILEQYSEEAPTALFATYAEEANNDYGAHFHVMKIFGWLKHAPAYDLLIEALQNRAPQFQKSRAAAAIALGELGDRRAIPSLQASLESPIWDLKYAALMALEKLGDVSGIAALTQDADWCIRDRALQAQAALMTV